MKNAMHLNYDSIRKSTPPGVPIVLLHIGEDQTLVASGMADEPDQVLVLQIGASRTSNDFFKHNPPLPLEIENAIMEVEDEITRARTVALKQAPLYSVDERVQHMADILGNADASVRTLRIEQVEDLFNQLAARSQGRPATQVDIPDDLPVAVTLLILREFMHHLHFDTIQCDI
jgi:exopolyphosphatase/pppGpp-phosphohydrolase